jgi:hypothetical protein
MEKSFVETFLALFFKYIRPDLETEMDVSKVYSSIECCLNTAIEYQEKRLELITRLMELLITNECKDYEAIKAFKRGSQTVLVVDNLEHVIDDNCVYVIIIASIKFLLQNFLRKNEKHEPKRIKRTAHAVKEFESIIDLIIPWIRNQRMRNIDLEVFRLFSKVVSRNLLVKNDYERIWDVFQKTKGVRLFEEQLFVVRSDTDLEKLSYICSFMEDNLGKRESNHKNLVRMMHLLYKLFKNYVFVKSEANQSKRLRAIIRSINNLITWEIEHIMVCEDVEKVISDSKEYLTALFYLTNEMTSLRLLKTSINLLVKFIVRQRGLGGSLSIVFEYLTSKLIDAISKFNVTNSTIFVLLKYFSILADYIPDSLLPSNKQTIFSLCLKYLTITRNSMSGNDYDSSTDSVSVSEEYTEKLYNVLWRVLSFGVEVEESIFEFTYQALIFWIGLPGDSKLARKVIRICEFLLKTRNDNLQRNNQLGESWSSVLHCLLRSSDKHAEGVMRLLLCNVKLKSEFLENSQLIDDSLDIKSPRLAYLAWIILQLTLEPAHRLIILQNHHNWVLFLLNILMRPIREGFSSDFGSADFEISLQGISSLCRNERTVALMFSLEPLFYDCLLYHINQEWCEASPMIYILNCVSIDSDCKKYMVETINSIETLIIWSLGPSKSSFERSSIMGIVARLYKSLTSISNVKLHDFILIAPLLPFVYEKNICLESSWEELNDTFRNVLSNCNFTDLEAFFGDASHNFKSLVVILRCCASKSFHDKILESNLEMHFNSGLFYGKCVVEIILKLSLSQKNYEERHQSLLEIYSYKIPSIDNEFSENVTLEFADGSYSGSRVYLKTLSSFFRSMFESNFVEKTRDVINLRNYCTLDTFRRVLSLVEGRQLESVTTDVLLDLVNLADVWQIGWLRNFSLQAIVEIVHSSNQPDQILDLVQFAHTENNTLQFIPIEVVRFAITKVFLTLSKANLQLEADLKAYMWAEYVNILREK